MKKQLFILVFYFLNIHLSAQNLVSNPSFEEFEHCLSKKETDEIFLNIPSLKLSQIKDWTCPSAEGTADLFQVCFDSTNGLENRNFGTKSAFGVPRNNNGWQEAHTGKAYAGIYVMSELFGNANYREYLQGKLSETLEKNKIYTVSFWCNLSDNSTLATQDLAVYFSKKAISYPDSFAGVIEVEPQIKNENGRFLTNQRNWVKVTASYQAKGDEKYFLIGNFKKHSPNDYLVIFKEKDKYLWMATSYYFIDDVCVSLNPEECFASQKDTIDLAEKTETFIYEPTKMRFKGTINDIKTKKPVSAQISFLKDSKLYSANENGYFEILTDTLSPNFVFFKHENYFPHSERITQKVFQKLEIKLTPLKKGEKAPITYYYQTTQNQTKLMDYCPEELKIWADFLKTQPKMQIQVNCHGLPFNERKLDPTKTVKEVNELLKKMSLERTQSLSREIAQKLIDFGVNPEQITYKGFGDEKMYGGYKNEIEWIGDLENTTVTKDSSQNVVKNDIWNINKIQVNQKILLENLHFRPNSAELNAESLPILTELLVFLEKNKEIKIEIHGHTDNGFGKTSPAVLQKLSEDRAWAVKKYLIEKGILENRLQTKGFGMSQPVASNQTDEGKSKNRRTELLILSK